MHLTFSFKSTRKFLFYRIVTRVGAKDRIYKNTRFPAGMAIQANVWALHRDDEYWEDAEEFKPERSLLSFRKL